VKAHPLVEPVALHELDILPHITEVDVHLGTTVAELTRRIQWIHEGARLDHEHCLRGLAETKVRLNIAVVRLMQVSVCELLFEKRGLLGLGLLLVHVNVLVNLVQRSAQRLLQRSDLAAGKACTREMFGS
jgi:hypothetical protein